MRIRLHLKIFIFIIIFILTKQIKIYELLMIFAFLHELGHMLAGIFLGFKPCDLEIMPLGVAIAFKTKVENYNYKIKKGTMLTLKKIIIATSGPLTNIILSLIFFSFNISLLKLEREVLIYANILIALFNLIPIYPLDGGRIVDGILTIFCGRKKAYIYTNKIANVCIVLLTIICSIAILYLRNVAILFVLAYLWYLVISENIKIRNKQIIYNELKKIKQENEELTIS